jgi:hypothetical protein
MALTVAFILMTTGGFMAMYGLNLPETTMVPHIILFMLLMITVLMLFSLASMVYASKPRHIKDAGSAK